MQRIFAKLGRSSVARNAGWIIVGRVIHMLLALAVSLLTARYLGPDNYGLINYAGVYTTFFFSLCTLGINSILVKEFVDAPEGCGEIIGTALLLRFLSSTFSILTIIGIALVVDRGEPTTIWVVALCSLSLVFQIADTFNYWFQYQLKSKYCALATTIAYIVVSAYKLLMLALNMGVEWFAISSSIDYMVVGLFLWIAYKRNGGVRLSYSWHRARQMLARSYHYILSGLMIAIYSGTDRLMLKHMMNEAEVGYYSTALSICNMWVFLLSAIIDSMKPVIMQHHSRHRERYETMNRQMYAIVFYVSVAVSCGFMLMGDAVVYILYGKAYMPAAAPLRVVTWYTAFSYLGVARETWIICENRQRYLKYLYGGAALANVVLNWLLIPDYGASGAAMASLITQISTIFIFPALIRELRPNAKLMLEAITLRKVKRH